VIPKQIAKFFDGQWILTNAEQCIAGRAASFGSTWSLFDN
jgi:hypothetical protein